MFALPTLASTNLRATPALLLLAVLAACGADPGLAESASSEGPRVIQPGKPGEAATTVDPDTAVPRDTWNHTDMAFMQMMIPHHAQALEMSKLAGSRAKNQSVRRLAERIRGAQAPEILAMSAWLDERNLEVPRAGDDPMDYDHSRHGHNAMTGMLTPAQMRQLAAARGREFDRLFLTGMIRHHAGAVDMAEQAARDGSDVIVGEMTAEVAATQSAEINRMRDLRSEINS